MQAVGKIIVKYRKLEEDVPIDPSLPLEERKALEKKKERKTFRIEREDVA
jgi:hypothetical protein